jgi:5-methyltetrahydrofolate--homocysteine methyltransferase
MQRAGLDIPLLIGGATTSKVHTAVKIEEHYTNGQTIHVLDASRAVTVVEAMLGGKKEDYVKELKADYARLREHHEKHRGSKRLLTLEEARNNALKLDWDNFSATIPQKPGITTLESYPLEELVPYIDWTPFFQTWELHGKFPAILSDEIVGLEALRLYEDAKNMLQRIVEEKWLTAKAVVGLFPAKASGDDILVYESDRKKIKHTIHTLRQQTQKTAGQPNIALSDFICPEANEKDDYIGAFVVTTGHGIEKYLQQFENDHDDYSSIMLKALADRLAEAFAEKLHEMTRKDFWGYSKDEKLSNEELIKEAYKGIRPAPGYPACPDHTEKTGLFELLDATKLTGVELTESLAMHPASSVSGWYFAHPDAKYFGLGKITMEQVEAIAKRKNYTLEEMKRWLSPVIND